MALGSRLELLVILSRCGSLVHAGTAAAILWEANQPFPVNQLMCGTMSLGGILWGLALLMFQFAWLYLEDFEPGNVALLVLIAVDWAVACLSAGSACAALAANQYAIQHQYRTAAAMVCAAGALAAVSALGMLRIHGSRFAPAQAP
ncbi:unnamed protein product [Triticum aestivum]|uniref:CASP-like protein n=2 Tax=Triticum aestivum TaxID=4565 RepID=A0A9R1EPN3_WHEAT|nr:uncharacterized protein LOC123048805 [Triticum aestivum]KAF7014263.1 hypothetical protein CFC21_028279 [Triticum aestivum]SPT16496.1 unnamed protein product [Triticum aestivum]